MLLLLLNGHASGGAPVASAVGGHWRSYPRRGYGSDVDVFDEDDAVLFLLFTLT